MDSRLTPGSTGREQQRPNPNAYSDNANEYEVQRVAYAAGVPREMLSVFRADPFETKLCVFGPDAVFETADDQVRNISPPLIVAYMRSSTDGGVPI